MNGGHDNNNNEKKDIDDSDTSKNLSPVEEWLEEVEIAQEKGSTIEEEVIATEPLGTKQTKTPEEQLAEDELYNFPPTALAPKSAWEFTESRKTLYERRRRTLERKKRKAMNNQNSGSNVVGRGFDLATSTVNSVSEASKGSGWGRTSTTNEQGTTETYGCCHYLLCGHCCSKGGCCYDCCIEKDGCCRIICFACLAGPCCPCINDGIIKGPPCGEIPREGAPQNNDMDRDGVVSTT